MVFLRTPFSHTVLGYVKIRQSVFMVEGSIIMQLQHRITIQPYLIRCWYCMFDPGFPQGCGIDIKNKPQY